MADIKKLIPYILKWEGGLSNHRADKASAFPCPTPYRGQMGYHTNKGITYATWVNLFDRSNDQRFLEMKQEDFEKVLKTLYWDRAKADFIRSQAVANIVVDWIWASGVWGIKFTQRLLGLKEDGVVGAKTLEALNNADGTLAERLLQARIRHFKNLAQKPSQSVFLKGWLNRMHDLKKWNDR